MAPLGGSAGVSLGVQCQNVWYSFRYPQGATLGQVLLGYATATTGAAFQNSRYDESNLSQKERLPCART